MRKKFNGKTYIDIKETAKLIGVCPATIRNYIKQGKLESIKSNITWVTETSIQEFMLPQTLTDVLYVRLLKQHKNILQECADYLGISLSNYCRWVLTNHIDKKKENGDIVNESIL